MSDIAIRATGLTKQYRVGARKQPAQRLSDLFSRGRGSGGGEEFRALDDVSFTIAHGEIVGIVGRNGAGKSTLFKILSRVVRPSAGSAELHGRLASLLEVGTGFHPELTGRENIYMSGIILGMTRAEVARRFDEIIAFAGIERFLDTPIKWYSSGMQTRLGFAVAAHLEAEIMLIDEVLAVGDVEFQRKCLGKMKEVARGGRTVLFISHSMDSVQTLCRRAIWLDQGRVRADSTDVRHVTREYLPHETSAGRAEWVNTEVRPSDSFVIPRAIRLIDPQGTVVSKPIGNNTLLTLVLDLEVQELDPELQVGYALYADDGGPLWWSFHTDRAQDDWPQLRKGRVRITCDLPTRLLNEGCYRVEFLSCIYFKKWFHGPSGNGPSISFEIQGELSDSPFWRTRREGILAPAMQWHVDR
jgi:lipopolysaccharide transport system ATP-binding protein